MRRYLSLPTARLCVGAVVAATWLGPVVAATHEQIVEVCRERLRPQIMACAMAKGLRGNHEAVREQCGVPLVRPCVQREEQKQATQVAPPSTPTAAQDGGAGAVPAPPVYVAPPRTIADITAILDSEKPDQAKISARMAAADEAPPTAAPPAKLAQFYYDRASARALLLRNNEALADAKQALEFGKGIDYRQSSRIRQFIALQYRSLGDLKQAMAEFELLVRDGNQQGRRGSTINALSNLTRTSIALGDVSQADAYARRVEAVVQEARGSPNPRWRASYPIYGHSWEADAIAARAAVLEARGQYAEAEAAFRRAEAFRRAAIADRPKFDFPPPAEQMALAADLMLGAIARTEAKQSRLNEAEADTRRALLSVLDRQSKYSSATPQFIIGLATIMVEQGRYQDAEKLARSALDVERAVGIADDSVLTAKILSQLGNILIVQRKGREADAVYGELDRAIASWPQQQREALLLNGSRIIALYASGQIEAGLAAAESLVKRQTARTGEASFETAAAHGTLAIGLARAGRDADAIREFKAAIPVLLASSRDSGEDDDPTFVAARRVRLQRIVEAYIGVLARNQSGDVALETFGLADAVRGSTVQRALADASARLVVHDAAVAELVRSEQDVEKQIGAQYGALNNLLSLPSEQRDEASVRAVNAAIVKLRDDRRKFLQEIQRRFPAYADLMDPKPPTVDAIRSALRPNEALLSFYFGQDSSFVWAVPKEGAVRFAAVPLSSLELTAKVKRLRTAVEPDVARIEEIPAFDVGLAHDLYAALLQPVEDGWKTSHSLIVVTNGALGELPLGLLPTAPAAIVDNARPLFSGYRDVPWLARTHAVTVIPSAAALVTLRRLPASSAQRQKLIGFGDPFFTAQEAAEAETEETAPNAPVTAAASAADGQVTASPVPLVMRASPHTEQVDKAELAMLPRLPDTRQELLAVARALDADPSSSLYLGKAANEQNVQTIDLTKFRIVAFATHGLVPGDLDGLTEPALALTAPDVAGVPGDGLLTMGKILALKLDADWVVLSACNTAAGAGAGAEAASGLGSAFFYAGTRALLVTNWSVHSASARELIGDLFRRQSANQNLSRAEALRQAMVALMDGPGAVDGAGRILYSYAHPLFWAPYSVIGDGG